MYLDRETCVKELQERVKQLEHELREARSILWTWKNICGAPVTDHSLCVRIGKQLSRHKEMRENDKMEALTKLDDQLAQWETNMKRVQTLGGKPDSAFADRILEQIDHLESIKDDNVLFWDTRHPDAF